MDILITGATGKIGRRIALAMAADSHNLAIHYHKSQDAARALAEECEKLGKAGQDLPSPALPYKGRGTQARACVFSCDLTQTEKIGDLVAACVEKFGGIDALIHFAAIFERTPLEDITEAAWDRTMDINLKAAFFLAREAGMAMRDIGGKIVLFSDMAAQRPYQSYLPYSISKAGVDAVVRGLAKTLAPKVAVNAIAPYIVEGGTHDVTLEKKFTNRPTTIDEIIELVRTLCDRKNAMTGEVVTLGNKRIQI